MYYVISCNGYHLIGKTTDKAIALEIAIAHMDGTYVNIIKDSNGKEIGDSVDGFVEHSNEYYRDAATQTGMYDAW